MDEALKDCPNVHSVIVVNRTERALNKENEVDVDYYQDIENFDADCPCEEMDAEDPLFILYTSGSTGKPKGVLQKPLSESHQFWHKPTSHKPPQES